MHVARSHFTALLVLCVFVATGCDPEESANYPQPDEANRTSMESTQPTPTTQNQEPQNKASQNKEPQNREPQVNEPQIKTHDREATDPGPRTRIVNKTFDDIKFDIEPDAPFKRKMLTDEIESLAGQRIRIRGWMLPTFQRKEIIKFVLVRDNLECCFGPGAALYDCIMVEMEPGKSADWSARAVSVEGTFTIQEFYDDLAGRHMAIYHLDGESVK